MIFRELSPKEETEFREYARKVPPENLEHWSIYHPVCRDEWMKRGIGPPKPKSRITENDYRMALESQSACNLSGIVYAFGDTLKRIWEEANVTLKGTDWVNRHPICRLYAEHISWLSGGGTPINDDTYMSAYQAVEDALADFKKIKKTETLS